MARRVRHQSVQDLQGISGTELRVAYSKLAYTARKRVERLSERYGSTAEVVTRRSKDFQPVRAIERQQGRKLTDQEVRMLYSDATRFLSSNSSRIREYEAVQSAFRQNFAEAIGRIQYGVKEKPIPDKDIDPLYQFLEDARIKDIQGIFGSNSLVRTFYNAKKQGLTREQLLGNIEYWVAHPTYRKDGKEIQRTRFTLKANRYSSSEDFYKGTKYERAGKRK